MDALRINGVYKRFGEKEVLKGLDLTVPQKSIFGFIGKNGAGKTTAMKTVLGLLRADAGEIEVYGERVIYGQTDTNRYIGYLPDVPEFYSFMSPAEYLSFCGQISGMNASEREDRARELLQLVGLSGEKRRIKGFSRGMKQRLGIAQALMNKPRLLICDEPTSALDPIGRKEILDILLSVREQTTVLFSTHVLTDVERICDRVAFLDNGVISASGTVEEIKGRFQRDEYRIEVLTEKDADILLEAFADMKKPDARELVFSEKDIPLHEVMTVLADKRIKVLRLERAEPTLEDLFTEVADK